MNRDKTTPNMWPEQSKPQAHNKSIPTVSEENLGCAKDSLSPSLAQDLESLIQVLGDICHQKYMGCTKSRNTGVTDYDWDYSYTDEVVNMLAHPEAKAAIEALIHRVTTECAKGNPSPSPEQAVTELLQRLYNKAQPVMQKHTGVEFNAVHHKDIDHEYFKLTGKTMR